MVRPRHNVYHDHVDKEHESGHHNTHYITKHYNEHDHPDRDHRANHRNDHHKGHSNDHDREHIIHHGTHPHERSQHSHNRVSNPNVNHHHAVQEHHPQQHHTYIHHQEGRHHATPGHNPNHLPKSPVTKNPAGKPLPITKPGPGAHPPKPGPQNNPTPKNPLLNIAKGVSSGTSTPGTKTKPTGQAPLHHGVNFGTAGTNAWDPNVNNHPGEGSATGVSAVNKNGKVPTVSTNTTDPPAGNIGSTLHHIGRQILGAWTNLGIWEHNTTTGDHQQYISDTNPLKFSARDAVRHDLSTAYENFGRWEVDRLRSIGIDPTP